MDCYDLLGIAAPRQFFWSAVTASHLLSLVTTGLAGLLFSKQQSKPNTPSQNPNENENFIV